MEGLGYIKNLHHGYPTQRHGLLEPAITAVDDEPVLLRNASAATLLIQGLGLLRSAEGASGNAQAQACYYEITVSGFALAAAPMSRGGGNDDSPQQQGGRDREAEGEGAVLVFSSRFLATPWQAGTRRRGLVGQSFTAAEQQQQQQQQQGGGGGATVVALQATVARDGSGLSFDLQPPPPTVLLEERELVVDVRRVGRGCAPPHVDAN